MPVSKLKATKLAKLPPDWSSAERWYHMNSTGWDPSGWHQSGSCSSEQCSLVSLSFHYAVWLLLIHIDSIMDILIIPKMFGSIMIYINQQGSGCSSCSPPVQPLAAKEHRPVRVWVQHQWCEIWSACRRTAELGCPTSPVRSDQSFWCSCGLDCWSKKWTSCMIDPTWSPNPQKLLFSFIAFQRCFRYQTIFFLYLHCIFNPKPRFDAFCDSNLSLSECCTPKSIGLSMFVIGFPEYKWPCVFCIPHFQTSPKKVSLNDFPGHPEVPPVWGAEVSAAVAQIDMQIEIQLKQRQPHLGTSRPVPWNRPWSNGGSDLVALTWFFYIY